MTTTETPQEDAVLDFCADLLADRRGEDFLRALFGRTKGEWIPVSELCDETRIRQPPHDGPGADLVVTWLDEPSRTPGFATVLFFSAAELWSNAALYNRRRLFERP